MKVGDLVRTISDDRHLRSEGGGQQYYGIVVTKKKRHSTSRCCCRTGSSTYSVKIYFPYKFNKLFDFCADTYDIEVIRAAG